MASGGGCTCDVTTLPSVRMTRYPVGGYRCHTRSAAGTSTASALPSGRRNRRGACTSTPLQNARPETGVSYRICKSRSWPGCPAGRFRRSRSPSRRGLTGSPSSVADHSVESAGSRTSRNSDFVRRRNRAAVWARPSAEKTVANSARWMMAGGSARPGGCDTDTRTAGGAPRNPYAPSRRRPGWYSASTSSPMSTFRGAAVTRTSSSALPSTAARPDW